MPDQPAPIIAVEPEKASQPKVIDVILAALPLLLFKAGQPVRVNCNIPTSPLVPKYPYSTGLGTVKFPGPKKTIVSFPGSKELFTFKNENLYLVK
jgi:hypothetical protein